MMEQSFPDRGEGLKSKSAAVKQFADGLGIAYAGGRTSYLGGS